MFQNVTWSVAMTARAGRAGSTAWKNAASTAATTIITPMRRDSRGCLSVDSMNPPRFLRPPPWRRQKFQQAMGGESNDDSRSIHV
ncbi:hypothetical protein GCM10020358_12100 [Amorphoplanes nipponensis]